MPKTIMTLLEDSFIGVFSPKFHFKKGPKWQRFKGTKVFSRELTNAFFLIFSDFVEVQSYKGSKEQRFLATN